MQSNNPVFSRNEAFKSGGYATFDNRSTTTAPAGGVAQQGMTAEQLQEQYQRPSATPVETGRMTYDDVVMKTAAIFGVLLVTGAVAWITENVLLLIVGAIGGLVLGLVNAFKREPSPALILAYGALQGLFLGGISRIFETQYNGIVVQAVLATVATFGVMLALYRSGKIRATPKFTRILLIAGMGYFVFILINLGLSLFADINLRSGPLGLLIGAFGAVLAALFLVLDFDFIEKGVKNGIPQRYSWTAAFGLVVTLIWLYIEMLRILAILRGDS